MTLAWGRDGSALRAGNNNRTQFKVAARSVPYQQHFVYGRHLIDTYQQIQRYDVAGNLSSYGLKPVVGMPVTLDNLRLVELPNFISRRLGRPLNAYQASARPDPIQPIHGVAGMATMGV